MKHRIYYSATTITNNTRRETNRHKEDGAGTKRAEQAQRGRSRHRKDSASTKQTKHPSGQDARPALKNLPSASI